MSDAAEQVWLASSATSSPSCYHTDPDCRLLGLAKSPRSDVTRSEARQRDLDLCPSCAGEVEHNTDDNDPMKYLNKIGYSSVHGTREADDE